MKLFADGASLAEMEVLETTVDGFTTNPTLLSKLGVLDYKDWARRALFIARNKPVSFEVLADDYEGIYREGMIIASWGSNAVVKVPCYNTKGMALSGVIKQLADAGVTVNVTAVTTMDRVKASALDLGIHKGYISLFAGRIADTGIDPVPMVEAAVDYLRPGFAELIWASCREVLNYYQALDAGCHAITMTPALIMKMLDQQDKDLKQLSIETVNMFHNDGVKSGLCIA